MVKRMAVTFMMVALAGLCSVAAVADELEKVEKELTAAWKKHKSMTAKMTTVTKMEQQGFSMESTGTGTSEMMRTGDNVLYRMEVNTLTVQKVAGQETKNEGKTTVVGDGNYVYTLTENAGQKMAVKTKMDKQVTGDPHEAFELLRQQFNLKLLPDEKIDGLDAYAIEATPKQDQGMAFRSVFYYAKEHGVLTKAITYDSDGKPMTTMTYTDLKFDVKIDPKHFVFEAPPGVEVLDQSGG